MLKRISDIWRRELLDLTSFRDALMIGAVLAFLACCLFAFLGFIWVLFMVLPVLGFVVVTILTVWIGGAILVFSRAMAYQDREERIKQNEQAKRDQGDAVLYDGEPHKK